MKYKYKETPDDGLQYINSLILHSTPLHNFSCILILKYFILQQQVESFFLSSHKKYFQLLVNRAK